MTAAAAAAAHKRARRAMGLLRTAARLLAPELDDVDVAADAHVPAGDGPALERALEAVRLAHHRQPGPIDVVVLARPAGGTIDRNPR